MGHVAPEVQNGIAVATRAGNGAAIIDYTKQPIFACGVLIGEMLRGRGLHPLRDYGTSSSSDAAMRAAYPNVQPYTAAAVAVPEHDPNYPDPFLRIVRRMMAFDPRERPSMGEVLRFFWNGQEPRQ
jgi:serine/threonine protein kinase